MSKSRSLVALGFIAGVIAAAGCGGAGGSVSSNAGANVPDLPTALLTAGDVKQIISQAVTRSAADGVHVVIAVSDREANVLGVFDMTGAPKKSADADPTNILDPMLGGTTQNTAIEKARTVSYLSSDQNAFSTRTGAYIVMDHFPPGVGNMPQGPLFGLPMSQLPCSDVRPANGVTGAIGGIPLYKNGAIAGGIGVDGANDTAAGSDEDEVIALAGASGIYAPPPSITADQIYLGGIQLAWIGEELPAPLTSIRFSSLPGQVDPNFPITAATAPSYPTAVFAGVKGELRFPIKDGVSVTAPDGKSVNLTAGDVRTIMGQSIALAIRTRAAIRQPVGVPARMYVGLTDVAGNIIGVFRMNDATGFSFDIVIQKGRTVTAFSDPNQALGKEVRNVLGVDPSQPIAFTSRTIEFMAEPFYPPGIDANPPGPFNDIQLTLYAKAPPNCQPYSPGDGVTLFPGSVPLYKDGVLVGGLGLSGDGVDQDDFITAGGAQGFMPPPEITADHITFRGTPLPFLKFPRHPLL